MAIRSSALKISSESISSDVKKHHQMHQSASGQGFRVVDLALNQAAKPWTPIFRSGLVPSVADCLRKCIGNQQTLDKTEKSVISTPKLLQCLDFFQVTSSWVSDAFCQKRNRSLKNHSAHL